MAAYRTLLLLTFASCVLSEEGKLFDPCNKNDINCLRNATQAFLEKSASGLEALDILAIDPLIIAALKVIVDEELGLAFDYTNINITGLKNQQISDFKMDTDKKSVVLKTKAVLNIAGDIKITFTKKNKEFTGTYTASITALGTSSYGYSLTKKGDQQYFEVGPETNTCEIIGEPVVTIDDVLQNALDNDADARSMKPGYETNKVSLRKKIFCKIVETAYITVIHNIRASAKTFPAAAFFKDI